MISPAQQKVIQIDITNACPHRCSNCTRFCGHHKKPFFMDLEDVKEAIDSLAEYPGMVGIMGGEPTLHPQFPEIVEYLNNARPADVRSERYAPIQDFAAYRNKHLQGMRVSRGLWSSLGPGYKKHYELIQDSFPYQCLNDHQHGGKHLALLVPRQELGIPDSEWVKYRDNCWVQTEWSACITPKGAFFCEVAGALDMLFDGPGGWIPEPGWWKRSPDSFGDQLQWCELCSACLPVASRRADEGVDDVSPEMHKKLQAMGSKKPMAVYDMQLRENANHNPEPYLPESGNQGRVTKFSTVRRIDAVLVCEGYDDYLRQILPHLAPHVDSITVATDPKDELTQLTCASFNVNCVLSKRLHENGAAFAKGKAMNDALMSLKNPDWILVMDADIILPPNFSGIRELVLNPGALYYTRRWGPRYPGNIPTLMHKLEEAQNFSELFEKHAYQEVAREEGRGGNAIEHFPFGYFQLFNVDAQVLQDRMTIYPEGSTSAEHDDKVFGFDLYKGKAVSLPVPQFDVIHLPHGLYRENWEGRRAPRLEEVYAYPEKYRMRTSKFVCVTPCVYDGRMWDAGATLTTARMDVPKHFRRA